MGIDLYYTPASAPCRTVLLTVAALKVDVNLKLVDLGSGKQHDPDYLKINPQHLVPTLVEGDFIIWESRAICRYLVNRFGKGSSLYPEDPKTRARVDQLLDFDLGTLYSRFADYFYPQLFVGAPAKPALLKKLVTALELFEKLLENRTYAACDHLTLADLSLVASISTFQVANIPLNEYKNILRWFDLVKSTAVDYQKANGEGAAIFGYLCQKFFKIKSEL